MNRIKCVNHSDDVILILEGYLSKEDQNIGHDARFIFLGRHKSS